MGRMGEVVRRAAPQGGHISRSQLLEMGFAAGAIDYRVHTRELQPVTDGVYRVFPPAGHVDHVRGALLALPRAVASHQSAAHLLALPRLPKLVPTVTVASHTTHVFPGVVVRRADDLKKSHLASAMGVRVTNVARTVFDLAGVLDEAEFNRVAEECLVAGRLRMPSLIAMIEILGRRGKRGTVIAREFARARGVMPARTTRLELDGRKLLVAAGLPPPTPEFPIPWDDGARRFDDAYPEARLAIEWDSREWHSQLEAMASDRRRDREAAAHGWVVLRFTWQDVGESGAEVAAAVRLLLEQRSLAS